MKSYTIVIVTFALRLCTASWTTPYSYKQTGNVVIAGLFPLHYISDRPDNYSLEDTPAPLICRRYNFLGFRWMQAMIFAIQEVNNRTDLLPNVTLGWELFDTCNTHARAVTQALNVVDSINKQPKSISALIGPTASDKSIVVSNILSVFDIPQISYGATSRLLSDKNVFSSFLRTIPNDDEQATAMVDLLLHHNWTWVGAVAGDDDYGRPGISRFKEEAAKRGICVEYTAYVSESMSPDLLYQTAREIKNYNATVFVTFISATHLVPLARHLRDQNVTDKVWIASEAWATSDSVRAIDADVFSGTLGIATRGGDMPGFRSFLEGVSPLTQPGSPFMKEFWEKTFQCSCPPSICQLSEHDSDLSTHNEYNDNCTGKEDFTDSGTASSAYLGWTDLEKSYNVYLAVYVVASALHNISTCVEGEGLLKDGGCPSLNNLTTWQLLAYIKEVNFYPPGHDYQFNFNENGDPNASYKLVSWVPQLNAQGDVTIAFVHVGNYSCMAKPKWSINDSAIYWRSETKEIPESVCNGDCPPGYYTIQLQSACCFKCVECPTGEYSTSTNSPICLACNRTFRADDNRTGCIPKYEEYIRWGDAFGITFSVLSAVGIIITIFTAGSFIKMRGTPLVKATNRELSFLLFFSVACCFLTPLLYVGKPQDWNCKGRTVSFSLSFTFCIAAILVKTLRVLTAFEARIPVTYKKRTKWLGEHVQVFVVMVVSLVQVVLSVAWLVVEPPNVVVTESKTSGTAVVVECNVGNVVIMGFVYGYLCLLALTAFVFAFRARKLPENFNEAKFITFSMLIFFIVWLSFIPAYLSTNSTNSTAVSCIAILASTFSLLACIFFPKLYVLYVTPQRNTVEEVRQNTANHAIRTSRTVAYSVRIKPPEGSSETSRSMIQDTSPNRRRRFQNSGDLFKDFSTNGNNNYRSPVTKSRHRSESLRRRANSLQPEIWREIPKEVNLKESNQIARVQMNGNQYLDLPIQEEERKDSKDSATFQVDIAGKISDLTTTEPMDLYEQTVHADRLTNRIDVKVAVRVNVRQSDVASKSPPVPSGSADAGNNENILLNNNSNLANRHSSQIESWSNSSMTSSNDDTTKMMTSSNDDITKINTIFESSPA